MARKKPKSSAGQRKKAHKVMTEFAEGKLRSGSKHGPKVKSRRQAVAIAMSESGQSRKKKRGKRR